MTIVGVLALQGDFAKHIEILKSIGVEAKEIRTAEDLQGCRGLIIPGGESTVISRQIDFVGIRQDLIEFAKNKPIFGTCAGLILMSTQIKDSSIKPLNLLDITVERNAFGRQADSFEAYVEVNLKTDHQKLFPAFFIRAPRIRAQAQEVEILATYQNEPILVRQGHHLGASFHPELTNNPLIHNYFVNLINSLI